FFSSRRRHTRFSRDWSSDVCSSDLESLLSGKLGSQSQTWFMQEDALGNIYFVGREHIGVFQRNAIGEYVLNAGDFSKIRKYLNEIGRASCRENTIMTGSDIDRIIIT